jgi:hypothetical protein
MEVLLVRRQVLESIGRAQLVLAERNIIEPGLRDPSAARCTGS